MQTLVAFIRSAQSAMDLFYPAWSSEGGYIGNMDTVCIPACINLVKGCHIGPEDEHSKEYKEQPGKIHGKNAEKQVLHAFQRLNRIGGFVIAGLEVQKQMTSDKRKTKGIVEAVRKAPSFRQYLSQIETFEADQVDNFCSKLLIDFEFE